eukprot:gene3552-6832_t
MGLAAPTAGALFISAAYDVARGPVPSVPHCSPQATPTPPTEGCPIAMPAAGSDKKAEELLKQCQVEEGGAKLAEACGRDGQ